MIVEQVRQLIDQRLFFIKNKIQKPREVLVIVARSPPKKFMNRSSRIYR
jgi:hypothetical protein